MTYAACDNAENPTACAEKQQHKMEKRHNKFIKKLGLSESQQAEFKLIKEQGKAEAEALKPALQAYREQVKVLMAAESLDEPAFIALQAANQDVFAAKALIKIKTKFAMKKLLTEEQLAKFNKMKRRNGRK